MPLTYSVQTFPQTLSTTGAAELPRVFRHGDVSRKVLVWDTDYCLWPSTLRIAIMSEILELPFATSPAMLSLPNFRVLIDAP